MDTAIYILIPVVVCASGLYAAADQWWRRSRPRLDAGVYPGSPAHQQALAAVAERQSAIEDAERIVAAEHARLATLYDPPTQHPVH